MIWFIAWRNIWRNRTRSLIIMIAIIIGIFAGTFASALMRGMMEQRVENVINTELSHIQFHHPDFFKLKEPEKYMDNLPEKLAVIDSTKGVEAHSERIIISSMVSSAETGSGVQLSGVNPAKEKKVTNIHEQIIAGDYFEEGKAKRIVIGKKLAEKLKVKVKSKVVLTFQALDDTLVYEGFKVAGIFETVNSTYDETHAFVRYNELAKALEMPQNTCHEIAVLMENNEAVDSTKINFAKAFPGLDVQSWTDLSPEMQVLTKSMELMTYIFIGIILLALLFSIINTMLMVVLERTKEIGMLMSVGMNKLRVFTMILLESVYLSGFAGIIGIVIGYGTAKFTSVSGIDLTGLYGEGLRNYGYDPVIFPDIDFPMVINITLMVLLTGVVASLVPARKALKLNPAEAVRTDM
ncbi:ABC transporter permease YtrF precursor [Salinivirga cyanobacteriivorans]|uniref:ABC transporter permease YtrF n=1 Tax=Salinivirga cyanobacteriivorans TaxID=1307839 RepID=A0A0S2HWI3_9BACT|nr:FtsX-like permease family protein [Salinivirga cyanobacteriivorans]ALO14406.1 ABC transporter permease YtrF precursor [Salinivirga cyanobacteriivorans]